MKIWFNITVMIVVTSIMFAVTGCIPRKYYAALEDDRDYDMHQSQIFYGGSVYYIDTGFYNPRLYRMIDGTTTVIAGLIETGITPGYMQLCDGKIWFSSITNDCLDFFCYDPAEQKTKKIGTVPNIGYCSWCRYGGAFYICNREKGDDENDGNLYRYDPTSDKKELICDNIENMTLSEKGVFVLSEDGDKYIVSLIDKSGEQSNYFSVVRSDENAFPICFGGEALIIEIDNHCRVYSYDGKNDYELVLDENTCDLYLKSTSVYYSVKESENKKTVYRLYRISSASPAELIAEHPEFIDIRQVYDSGRVLFQSSSAGIGYGHTEIYICDHESKTLILNY